jgi:hypothetical protein
LLTWPNSEIYSFAIFLGVSAEFQSSLDDKPLIERYVSCATAGRSTNERQRVCVSDARCRRATGILENERRNDRSNGVGLIPKVHGRFARLFRIAENSSFQGKKLSSGRIEAIPASLSGFTGLTNHDPRSLFPDLNDVGVSHSFTP